ncbi:MAG TPA: hypothetical protein VJO35_11710 [Terriglobales bacterium]|nr:hypothetical protein [Terriglobales bacterium]
MRFIRSFFFSLLCVGVAVPVLAADKERAAQVSPEIQTNEALATEVAPQLVLRPYDMPVLRDIPSLDWTQPNAARKSAPVANSGCYALRVYEMNPKVGLAEQGVLRGYTTCEWATNYQIRSAIAHDKDAPKARLK